MSWDVLTAVTGAVSAIAVAVTVVYLAIRVRRNTLAMHSQTYHLATEALAEVATILGSNPQIARFYRIGLTTPGGSTKTSSRNSRFWVSASSVDTRISTFSTAQGWSTRTSGLVTVKIFSGTFTGRECKRGGRIRGLRIARAFASLSKTHRPPISSHQLIDKCSPCRLLPNQPMQRTCSSGLCPPKQAADGRRWESSREA